MIEEINKAVNGVLHGLNEGKRITVFESGDQNEVLAVFSGLDPEDVPSGWDIVVRTDGCRHRVMLWPRDFDFYETDRERKLVEEIMPKLCAFADGYAKALRDKQEDEKRAFEMKSQLATKALFDKGYELRRVYR